MKLKETTQHYECKECKRHFYPHTSRFFARLEQSLNERMFFVIKKHIDFRGKRDVKYWRLLLRHFFTVREYPEILRNVLKNVNFSPSNHSKSVMYIPIMKSERK